MARQAAQKEAADARRRRRPRWRKEKVVARRVKAGERKSDIKSELESEDPMDVDDMVFSAMSRRPCGARWLPR